MKLRPRLALSAAVLGLALVAGGAVVGTPFGPQSAAAGPEWRKPSDTLPVSYRMTGELTTLPGETYPRLLRGTQRIVFTNTSLDHVEYVYLHLYANAFRNNRSTMVREILRDGGELPEEMTWGGIELGEVTAAGGQRLSAPEFVAFDDGNADDRTVARIKLSEPLAPGVQIVMNVPFRTTFPRPLRRMGAWKEFVFAAQWYPKVGRYLGKDSGAPDLRDGWFCPQYHSGPEFCADFADYDVTLTLPAEWKSSATGVRATPPQDPAVPNGPTRTERWTAHGVVDFAWAAGRRVEELSRVVSFPDAGAEAASDDPVLAERRRVQAVLDVPASDVAQPDVEVVLLLQPEHLDQAERHFEAARVALGLYSAWLGPYPYPRLTIVDPAFGAGGVGGMEYPMLVTAGTAVGSTPASQRPEQVIVHEIGHQWFMNLIATNETLEAWLDEGMNTFFTAKATALAFGPQKPTTTVLGRHFDTELPYTFPGLSQGWPGDLGWPSWTHPPKLEAFRLWRDYPALRATTSWRWDKDPILPSRRSYHRSSLWDELPGAGYRYVDGRSYGVNSYPRMVLFLETLVRTARQRFGPEEGDRRMLRAFREYAREHRFSHPTTDDLLRAFRDHAGLDPAPLWDALAKTSGRVEYAIEKVFDSAPPKGAGIGFEPKPENGGAAAPAAPEPKRFVVRVRRRGEVVVPQVLRVVYVDDKGERITKDFPWDAKARWADFAVEGEVREALLDPDRTYLQELVLSDNTWHHKTSPRPGVKWGGHTLLWLENALTTYGQLL